MNKFVIIPNKKYVPTPDNLKNGIIINYTFLIYF